MEEVKTQEFDPRGEYKHVVKSVEQEGNGNVQIFRVQLSGARCEYWVVTLDDRGGRVVGLKAGSVES